jgi:hypothetical protein
MNEQKINIAIAESMGTLRHEHCHLCQGDWKSHECECTSDGQITCPSYTTDLNAMHEVMMTVLEKDINLFQRIGHNLIKQNCKTGDSVQNATALQRATNYVKTIGKYTS